MLGCVSTGTYEPEGVTPTRAFDRTSGAVRVQLAVNIDFILYIHFILFFFVKRKFREKEVECKLIIVRSIHEVYPRLSQGWFCCSFQFKL